MNSGTSLDPRIDVAEVELPIQIQEDWVIIDVGRDVVSLRPGRGLEVLVSQLGEAVLVEVVDLVHVPLLDHVLEVLEELLDLVGDGVVEPVLDGVPGVSVPGVLVLVKLVIGIHPRTSLSRRRALKIGTLKHRAMRRECTLKLETHSSTFTPTSPPGNKY